MNTLKSITLPYSTKALEPIISEQTINFHYGKHLQTYVNNLISSIEGTPFADMTLHDIVMKAEAGMLNNAGQILNHNLYFAQFQAPKTNNKPTKRLEKMFIEQFGSFEAFQTEFVNKGVTLFGSGWVWLSVDTNEKLIITQETNASNPIQKGLKPLLTFDVWEHAYYIDYQNRRADHLKALWQIINWNEIEQRL